VKLFIGSIIFFMVSVFGGEIIVDSPKIITPEWEEKVLGIRFGVTTLDNAVHEMVDGLIDDHFDKTFFDRLKTALSKQPAGKGEYVEYWDNGNIKVRLPFKDGKAHGHVHGWHENRIDAFKGFFKEGVKQGIHITFFKTDPKLHWKKARILTFNMEGKLDGKMSKCHPNGYLWLVISYDNGIANGPLEGWDVNRKYFLSAQYKKGVLQMKPPLPPGKRKRPKMTLDEKYVNEIIRDFEKITIKEYGLRPVGSGARMPFDVEKIDVMLSTSKKMSFDEARTLYVTLRERFTKFINDNEKIRPYLRQYPINFERADISLSFERSYGDKTDLKRLSHMFVGNYDQIMYFNDSPTSSKRFIKSEPYDEALKLVLKKQQKK
jgi:hypothetical protein